MPTKDTLTKVFSAIQKPPHVRLETLDGIIEATRRVTKQTFIDLFASRLIDLKASITLWESCKIVHGVCKFVVRNNVQKAVVLSRHVPG